MGIDLDNFEECIAESESIMDEFKTIIRPELERFGVIKISGSTRNCSIIKGIKGVVLKGKGAELVDVVFTDEVADLLMDVFNATPNLLYSADGVIDRVSSIEMLKDEVSGLEFRNGDLEDMNSDLREETDKAEEEKFEIAAERDSALEEIERWRKQSLVMDYEGLTLVENKEKSDG